MSSDDNYGVIRVMMMMMMMILVPLTEMAVTRVVMIVVVPRNQDQSGLVVMRRSVITWCKMENENSLKTVFKS